MPKPEKIQEGYPIRTILSHPYISDEKRLKSTRKGPFVHDSLYLEAPRYKPRIF